jgi:hypothetical protein
LSALWDSSTGTSEEAFQVIKQYTDTHIGDAVEQTSQYGEKQ